MFAVILLGFLFSIDNREWMFVAIAVGLVFIAELLNTAVERLADYLSPERNEEIRQVKDYAAGAVLIAAVVAVVIGLLIFVPKLFAI